MFSWLHFIKKPLPPETSLNTSGKSWLKDSMLWGFWVSSREANSWELPSRTDSFDHSWGSSGQSGSPSDPADGWEVQGRGRTGWKQMWSSDRYGNRIPDPETDSQMQVTAVQQDAKLSQWRMGTLSNKWCSYDWLYVHRGKEEILTLTSCHTHRLSRDGSQT